MKVKFLLELGFWVLMLFVSCKRDEISFETPSADLKFSQDVVFCDTVYNQVRSETYFVTVYNRENKDVRIPKITLEGGSSSPYRINVDGKAGTEFFDIPLRKNDSLRIFIEIAPVANAREAIAEDKIVFSSPKGNQHVTLLSVVQDAEFFIKSDTNPNILNANTTWRNDKAKIIFGELTLAEGKTLDREEGTKVYFTKNSSLKISKNAKLNINGLIDKEVIFRGDRNDIRHDTIPLNWDGIYLEENAVLNMNYAKIFGGDSGLNLYKTTANIKNSIIHTFQEYGIYSVKSKINAENMVMNNCGRANLAIFGGGEANLTHCTLANYWYQSSASPALGIYATNKWRNNSGNTENANLELNIKNSIVYGKKENSILFEPVSGYNFNYLISHSLIKYNNKAGYNFDTNPQIISSIKNGNPKFLNHAIAKMNLRTTNDSPAKKKGNVSTAAGVPQDIKGVSRTSNPTIGAYQ